VAAEVGAWRAAALIAVAGVGAALSSSVQAVVPLPVVPGLRPGPDVILVAAVFLGLSGRGEVAVVAALGTLLGYLADLASGSPKGLHMLLCLGVVLLARAASARVVVRGFVAVAVSCGFFAALEQLALLGGRVALEPSALSGAGWAPLRRAALSVMATALWAPLLFFVLRRVDRRVGRLASRRLAPGAPRSLSQVP